MDSLPVKLLRAEARLPRRAHGGDLGYDLYSAAPAVILPGDWSVVSTGISLALEPGYAGLVTPRSGLAAKAGVTVLNSPGLIDAGFRGEVGVVLINHGDEPFHVSIGDRIAQLVVVECALPEAQVVEDLPDNEDGRGEGGFGSSGVSS